MLEARTRSLLDVILACRTAASARVSAREGRRSVDHLALILGIAVPAVAILPLGLADALLRVRRR